MISQEALSAVKQKISQIEFFVGKQNTHAPPTAKAQPDPMIENINKISSSVSEGMSVGNKPHQKRKNHVDVASHVIMVEQTGLRIQVRDIHIIHLNK